FCVFIYVANERINSLGRMYVSGRVDIVDMVDIDLFTVVALNMIVLKLGYTGESEPMFYNYLRPLTSLDVGLYALACEEDVRCLATLVRSFKLIEEPVCDSVTPRSLPQHDSSTPLTASHVIDDVMRQLSFDETKLDGEAGFADVARSGADSSGLSHDESFGVDDLDLNLNEPVNLNVSQVEIQYELPVFEEPDVGPTQEPILAESSKDAGTDDDDDDDVDEDFLVDEENEIVEHDVDVYLFGISRDLPFDNISITNLVLDDVLEGEEVDVINADGFNSDLGNDEERNYKKRMLAKLRTEMEGVINASGKWKYLFYTDQKFTSLKEAKDRVYLHFIKSKRNLKLYKNDTVIRARCKRKEPVFTMSQGTGSTGPYSRMEVEPSGSISPTTRSKKKEEYRDYVVELQSTNPNTTVKIAVERNTDPSLPTRVFQRIYICLGALKLGFKVYRRDLLGLDGAFMKGSFPGQGDDIDLHPNSNFTFISDRQKGIISAIKTVYPSVERRYCLRHIHENIKQGWCGQAYKDLLCRVASATNVKDFEKYMLELKTINPKAHEWLNKILVEHWARSYFLGRVKSDLLLNNICEVFNGKIVKGRDKRVIILLEYIGEYCMKRTVNVQGVVDKCIGPLAPTATRIMESIKKKAHLMKVQRNGANKYQVLGSLGDQCVVDVVSMTCSCRKWELTGIPYKHDVAACWNMALNDRATPPPETWVNPCYWLSTWKETYSHKIQLICRTNYWEKSTCPTTLLPPKHHVQVGQLKKKIKRSKHEDELFVKDEGSGSASRQAQQTEPEVGQDGLGGSGVGFVIDLFDAAGEGGAGDLGDAGVASQGSSHTRWTRKRVQTERISPQKELSLNLQANLLPVLKCQ
nr:hypothetical protein [Tanacetum cinerariifolium]